jgi:hypothetical protein
MLSTLCGYLVLTLLLYAMLRRHLEPWTALVLSLPLVFTPPSVHTYALHPPRQAALTLAFAAYFALDRARGRRLVLGAGGALATLACFADPYALVLLPASALFCVLCARDGPAPAKGVASAAAGMLAGALPLASLWTQPDAKHGTTGLTLEVLAHNWRLFADTCLPWGLSYQAWAEQDGGWAPWTAPAPMLLVQLAGACLFVGGVLFALPALASSRIPWPIRRIGAAGFAACALTVAGFLGSVMVMDHFSTRYLATLVLAAPMALAPLAYAMRERTFAALLAPYLASAALNGWLGFVPWVDGLRIVRTDDGAARDEAALERELIGRGVTHAMADYWVSYRLTFLWRERVVVVPKNRVEDRYPPYADAFERARVVAYIFDPARSREPYASIPEQLEARGVRAASGEWLRVGRLTALVVHRE